jgi:predicted dehydrogenase
MSRLISDRRQFLQATAAAGFGYWVAGGLQAAESKSPNEKIQLACFGVGGKGQSDVQNASKFGQIYALCDVDSSRLEGMAKKYKTEHNFSDFRELLDRVGDRIDAVTVSTPDHNHAVIASKAMRMGKHVYCQKPLTHTIWEARRLGEIARETGVATQMGNQFTAFAPMRKAAYQIRAGQLGAVKEVHIWTDRPVWPQGERRPKMKPVPATLDWESWLGPAPFRAYGDDAYHPFKWRGWWDFGTGALGDMACHTCNLPFMALNMRDPVSVEAECAEHDGDSYPPWSKIKYEFPELNGRAPFTMFWYDGGQLPAPELFKGVTLTVKRDSGEVPPPYQSGALLIGDKATMYAAGDYADNGVQIVGDVPELDVDYPRSPGHEREWFDAMRDPKKPAMSNFPDYAGPLVETILLGNLAVWKRGRVEWDPVNLKALNDPTLERIVRCEYRDGYEVL